MNESSVVFTIPSGVRRRLQQPKPLAKRRTHLLKRRKTKRLRLPCDMVDWLTAPLTADELGELERLPSYISAEKRDYGVHPAHLRLKKLGLLDVNQADLTCWRTPAGDVIISTFMQQACVISIGTGDIIELVANELDTDNKDAGDSREWATQSHPCKARHDGGDQWVFEVAGKSVGVGTTTGRPQAEWILQMLGNVVRELQDSGTTTAKAEE